MATLNQANQLSQEQIDEYKSQRRIAALANLKGTISSLAAVWLSKGKYGVKGKEAIRNHVYNPSMETGVYQDMLKKQLEESREESGDGNVEYNGIFKEAELLGHSLNILRESFNYITLGDLFTDLMGNVQIENKEVQEFLKSSEGRYLEDIARTDKGKKIVQGLQTAYENYLVNNIVATALQNQAVYPLANGGLERILAGKDETNRSP